MKSLHSCSLCVFVAVMTCLLLFQAQKIQAQTLYVDTCAENGGNGTAQYPFNKVSDAVEQVKLEPGKWSNISIKSGTYAETMVVDIPLNKPLTLTASGGPVVIGAPIPMYTDVGITETCIDISRSLYNEIKTNHERGGHRTLENPSCGFDNGVAVKAKVYYPLNEDGEMPCGQLPVVIYAHGRRIEEWSVCSGNSIDLANDYQRIDGILSYLAKAGIVVVSVDFSLTRWVGASFRERILYKTIEFLCAENKSGTNIPILKWKLDLMRIGLLGHSTGGLAAIMVAQNIASQQNLCTTGIKIAAVGLIAPAGDSHDAVFLGEPPDVPMLVIHGTNELFDASCTTQVKDQPVRIYEQAKIPKHLVAIKGANHFGYYDDLCFMDLNYPEKGGCVDNRSSIGSDLQQHTARNYVQAFFSHYLMGSVTLNQYLPYLTNATLCNPPSGDYPSWDLTKKEYKPVKSFSDLASAVVGVFSCPQEQ